MVYAVEFSHRSGRDLVNMAKKRTNVIPIIEDARHPAKYRMLVGMVDVIFSDVAQPDQVWSLFSYTSWILFQFIGCGHLSMLYLLLLIFSIKKAYFLKLVGFCYFYFFRIRQFSLFYFKYYFISILNELDYL